MRRAAAEGDDACLLRRTSLVQQAQQAIRSLPATASASCGLMSQQQTESNMQLCDLSVQQAPRLQTQLQVKLLSTAATAQQEAQDDKAHEHTQLSSSLVHGVCNSSTEYALQPRPHQQAAPCCFSHTEAQPAVHEGAALHTLALCDLASAFVDGKAGRTSACGSVWVPQSSLQPDFHCKAARAKAETSSKKRMPSGVSSHKSVRRSSRRQAIV